MILHIHPLTRRSADPMRIRAKAYVVRMQLRGVRRELRAIEVVLRRSNGDMSSAQRIEHIDRQLVLECQARQSLAAVARLMNHAALWMPPHNPELCCLCLAERGET